MKYFRDANLYRAVITVDNLVPRVFCLFGQLKPEDSGYGSTKIRNPESGIRKRNHGNESRNGNGNGIRERSFQAIDLKKLAMTIKINKDIK